MKYYRYENTFYKVLSITPQTRGDLANLTLVEFGDQVGEDPKDMNIMYNLPNGNDAALVNTQEWALKAREIQEIDFYVWRHIGAPGSKGDK